MKARKTFSNRPEPKTESGAIYLDTSPMPRAVAERVKFLRVAGPVIHSWRALAEKICEEFPDQPAQDGWLDVSDASGNQLYGIDLCRMAAHTLGEDVSHWEDEIEKALSAYSEWAEKERKNGKGKEDQGPRESEPGDGSDTG